MDINALIQSFLQIPTQANETGVPLGTVFNAFLIYLALLWVAFCVWVFFDAKRRFHNIWVAVVATLFVFILNFPALILYLVVRPEDEYGHHYHSHQAGGVDVPVVKFVGENGEVKMALNLHITSQLHKQADMTLDLGISGDRDDMKVIEVDTETEPKSLSSRKQASKKQAKLTKELVGRISAWRSKLSGKNKGANEQVSEKDNSEEPESKEKPDKKDA